MAPVLRKPGKRKRLLNGSLSQKFEHHSLRGRKKSGIFGRHAIYRLGVIALGTFDDQDGVAAFVSVPYGGATAVSPYSYAELYATGGDLTFSNSIVSTGTFYGLSITGGNVTITSSSFNNQSSSFEGTNGYGINANSSGTLTITSSSFNNNQVAAATISLSNGINFIPSGNSASGPDAGFIISGNIATSTTWYKDNIPSTGNLQEF